MNGKQGYYVLASPDLGLFGPYDHANLNLAAIAAGHAERDVDRENTEIETRLERFRARFRAQTIQAIRVAAASLDPARMRAAAAAVEGLDDAVSGAVAAESDRLELALPVMVKPGSIEQFDWSRRAHISQ